MTNLFQISCAAFLLVFAALSQLFSRRRIYVAGVGVFTLASLGAALSPSLESLLLFRALQGLGAAAMLSIGPSIYRQVFPSRLLGSALGLSAMVVAGGYAAGPAIGGVLLSVADWPWLFVLPLPLGRWPWCWPGGRCPGNRAARAASTGPARCSPSPCCAASSWPWMASATACRRGRCRPGSPPAWRRRRSSCAASGARPIR